MLDLTSDPAGEEGAEDQAPPHIIAYDAEWQRPAITELHAFKQMMRYMPHPPQNMVYLAFPWATLIDKLNTGAKDADRVLARLRDLVARTPPHKRAATVCQHILLRKFEHIFIEAGVTDIFWAHATTSEDVIECRNPIRLHPFPLFPAQFPHVALENFERDRPHLFSFIGARANKWYLTRSRDWILDAMTGDSRGVVMGRDQWHYHKTVYDFQTHSNVSSETGLVDNDASEQFKRVLKDTLFALCPSGSGPNSIRLWEALCVGAIPVILADGLRLPGPTALWEQAAVFCRETEADVQSLPDRLEELSQDKALINRKRAAIKQLLLLYGPDMFVSDILETALAPADSRAGDVVGVGEHAILIAADRIVSTPSLKAYQDARYLLTKCTNMLLSRPDNFEGLCKRIDDLPKALAKAERILSGTPLCDRYRQLKASTTFSCSHSAARSRARARVKVFLFGEHANRTPLHYPDYQYYFENKVAKAPSLDAAHVAVTGFDIDFKSAASKLREARSANPRLACAVISEEPLWDTIWTGDHQARRGLVGEDEHATPYHILNHQNDILFDFDKLPYFITTDNRFFQRYQRAFIRNAQMTPSELLTIWDKALYRSAFYAEKREDKRYDRSWPEQDVKGLSVYRTEVAALVETGRIKREGKGWTSEAKRQVLPDWHLDKLSELDRRCLIVSALENTHQSNYITEKLFDAYAVLGVPLYYAGASHRVRDITPEAAFLNLHGMSPAAAAAHVDAFEPDLAFAKRYLEDQRALAELFAHPDNLIRERKRVAARTMEWLESILEDDLG